MGGWLMMLRMSGGRGATRRRFWSGNEAVILLFIINRALVGLN